ncbi:hypothetical protein CAPTEDRAFT_188459 [Capitella teleta]|uniref:Uncharacterized protein n=1 Tax=Capitella teleta TaxID=283909 RepID=R7T6J7_CAPTE|nr:hypothetical protein CAPTEDRAFT_188459 [Capitella teleta]|eukprot:ELT88973.1 hypothetical protein CAPTEDRAFT_188459 [Capitella teleta]
MDPSEASLERWRVRISLTDGRQNDEKLDGDQFPDAPLQLSSIVVPPLDVASQKSKWQMVEHGNRFTGSLQYLGATRFLVKTVISGVMVITGSMAIRAITVTIVIMVIRVILVIRVIVHALPEGLHA